MWWPVLLAAVLCWKPVCAQEGAGGQLASDSLAIAADTLGPPPLFNGVEILLDYGKLLTLLTDFESKIEGGINLRFFDRFLLAGELGMATLNPAKAFDNADFYTIEGRYYRVGMDFDLPVDKKNHLYLGFRYGASAFEDRGRLIISNDVWEDYQLDFGQSGLTATWYELVLSSETQLTIGKEGGKIYNQRLHLGWKFRFRILGSFENREEPSIYAIPGYGRTFDKTIPALNLYLKYRLGR